MGAQRRNGGRLVLLASCLALFVLGGVLGVVGSFLNEAVPRVLGVGVPVGIVLAVLGNITAGLLGTRGLGNRLGGAIPAAAWFVVVILLGTSRREGDLVVTGDAHGLAFILLGALAAFLGLLPGPGAGIRRSRARRTPVPGSGTGSASEAGSRVVR